MNNGRWWEFYFVRYAMGTVIGGAIVSALMHVDCHLQTLLSWNLTDLHDTARVMVLGGYGLVYCYVSSIPILVLHATRSLLPLRSTVYEPRTIGRWLQDNSLIFIVMFLWLVTVGAVALPLQLLDSKNIDSTVAHIGFWLFLGLMDIPLLLIIVAIINRHRCYAFYKALARSRARQADAGELITSYRHLREHGNSILIVALEGVLGLVLFCAYLASKSLDRTNAHLVLPPQFYLYGVIAILWILPGALVWVFATLIEHEFIKSESGSRF